MKVDLKSIQEGLVEIIRSTVEKALVSVSRRLDDLESRETKDGKDGRDGRDGRDGTDGQPGRDSLEVDVLSTIDETRSYPRGTFASFKGGLWISRRTTNGLEGWDCIVKGFDGVSVEMTDERTVSFVASLTDGQQVSKSFSIPTVLDQGVFKEGSEYRIGDGVTFQGSFWIAQAETKQRPGDSSDWRLAVKKGRDGKNGTNGTNGRDGLNGKSWTGDRVK
jgi:hypothetical protein